MIIDINTWIGSLPFRTLRDNTPEALIARLDRAGIQKAAVSNIGAIFHRHSHLANEQLIRDIESHGDRLIPLGTIQPHSPHWEDDLDACVEMGMKGIRIFPPYQMFEANGPGAKAVAHACAERDLPLCIPNRIEDTRQHHPMDPGKETGIAQIADLVTAAPKTTIIITNARGIARSPLWKRTDLRDHTWYMDLSLDEIFYSLHTNPASMRALVDMIEEGGANHILFGTNLPISYAGPALVKRDILPVDAKSLENISHRTAAKLLKIH